MLKCGDRSCAGHLIGRLLCMDCRVKPGNDEIENRSRDAIRARVLSTPSQTHRAARGPVRLRPVVGPAFVQIIRSERTKQKGSGTPKGACPTVRAERARSRIQRDALASRRSTAALARGTAHPQGSVSGHASWDSAGALGPIRPPQPGGGDLTLLHGRYPRRACPSPANAPRTPVVVPAG